MQKTASKNIKYSRNARNETILKNQRLQSIQNANVKIYSTNYLELFSGKNRSKKNSIEKGGHFENQNPCKILTLGQKFKLQKKCQKPFYKLFGVAIYKKTAAKNIKYSRKEAILKISHNAKAIAHAKS